MAFLWDSIIKPIEILIKDPAITFMNVYSALVYGIYYSFFEVFAIVFPREYGFDVGETALVFLTIIVGTIIAIAIYLSYLHWYLLPDIMKRGSRAQEHRLVPSIMRALAWLVGLFLFGKL